MVEIVEVSEVDDEVVAAMNRLIPQLSSSNPPPTRDELAAIVGSDTTILLLARDESGVLGSLTLALFRIPTGQRAWIEDVVVDADARGKGVGRLLNEAALDLARRAGAKTVELTSRPSREDANRLYRRLGFVERETNVYRYQLG
jgi:ribosomal protein S18 acetylase RimI-like enzyme